jgi:hypothetical protein
VVAHCVRAVVATSCANALAQRARELKASRQVVKRMGLAPTPGGSVANGSRLGEAESATNPPKGWDEGQKGTKAAALLALAEAGDAGQR